MGADVGVHTRGLGEQILQVLVAQDGWLSPRVIAEKVGKRDGRSVIQPLRRLQRADLVHESRRTGAWYPTKRGREVDAILDRITVARGGVFEPTAHAGISISEVLALHAGRRS